MITASGVPRNARGSELRQYGKRHRELAQIHTGLRDHANWSKFFDPTSNKFVSKNRKVGTEKLYHSHLAQQLIQPPQGFFYDALSKHLVEQDRVKGATGLLAKYKGRAISNGVIYGEDATVSVKIVLFFPKIIDKTNQLRYTGDAKKDALVKERLDSTLEYIVDPENNIYQEDTLAIHTITTQAAIQPYLPVGRIFWTRASRFPNYIDVARRAQEGDVFLNSKGAMYKKKKTSLDNTVISRFEMFSSNLAAFKIAEITAHSPLEAFNRLTVPNRDTQHEGLYSRFTDALAAGSNLEDWLSYDYDKNAKSPDRVRVENGCGYEAIIRTFKDSFEKSKTTPKGPNKFRYKTLQMTPEWLYENVFTDGEPFTGDTSLSLDTMRKFFVKYRLELLVFDICGKALPEVSYKPTTLNNAISPTAMYVIHHNRHIYRIPEYDTAGKSITRSLNQLKMNANSIIYTQPALESLDVEEEKALSAHYRTTFDDTPRQFIASIEDLPKINTRFPKRNAKGKIIKDEFANRTIVACPTSMAVLLAELLKKARYEPKVKLTQWGAIVGLTMKINNVVVVISPPAACSPAPNNTDRCPEITTEAQDKTYCELERKLALSIRKDQTRSSYSSSWKLLMTDDFIRSPLKYGTQRPLKNVSAHDLNKAYTSFLRSITTVPVFNEFDVLEPFTYNKREDPPSSWPGPPGRPSTKAHWLL